jgi:type II secretory pathway pseudopilin PulG
MSDFLDTLRRGMQEAQQKFAVAQQKMSVTQAEFQAAQQRHAAAQAEFQVAAQEFQAYQTLVATQTRKEQPANSPPTNAPITVQSQVRLVPPVPAQFVRTLPTGNNPLLQAAPAPRTGQEENKSEGNKTEAVRELLRQHPGGMAPNEIWKYLQSQIHNRVYLYSILSRLKDRGVVKEKRGKYYYIEENQSQAVAQ